jgi:hypothetical protein
MHLDKVVELLGCEEVLMEGPAGRTEIAGCFAADLMSEVLAFAGHGALLLTGLTSVQSVHTADVADLHAVVFVNGKRPDPSVVAVARERGLPLLSTPLTMYEACGRLHSQGLPASVKG